MYAKTKISKLVVMAIVSAFFVSPLVAEEVENFILRVSAADHAWLGVHIQDLDPTLAEKIKTEAKYGAVIEHILAKSPADMAGLQAGDVIIRFENEKIKNAVDLTKAIRMKAPNDKVTIRLYRGNERKEIVAELGEEPKSGQHFFPTSERMKKYVFFRKPVLGVEVIELNPDLALYFDVGEDDGVLVTRVNDSGAAAKAGLKAGDIIAGINGTPVLDEESLVETLADYDDEEEINIDYYREGKKKSVKIKLDKEDLDSTSKIPGSVGKLYIPDYDVDVRVKMDKLRGELERQKDLFGDYKQDYERQLREDIERDVEKLEIKQEKNTELLQKEIERLREELEMLKQRLKELE